MAREPTVLDAAQAAAALRHLAGDPGATTYEVSLAMQPDPPGDDDALFPAPRPDHATFGTAERVLKELAAAGRVRRAAERGQADRWYRAGPAGGGGGPSA